MVGSNVTIEGIKSTPVHLCPTVSRGGSLYQALLPWHRCPGTADQEVKLGTATGVCANFVMLVKVDLPRVHHLPAQRIETSSRAWIFTWRKVQNGGMAFDTVHERHHGSGYCTVPKSHCTTGWAGLGIEHVVQRPDILPAKILIHRLKCQAWKCIRNISQVAQMPARNCAGFS